MLDEAESKALAVDTTSHFPATLAYALVQAVMRMGTELVREGDEMRPCAPAGVLLDSFPSIATTQLGSVYAVSEHVVGPLPAGTVVVSGEGPIRPVQRADAPQ